MTNLASEELLPVKEGLVSGEGPDDVRLLGSKCESCSEVSIGTNVVCLNCGNDNITSIEFSPTGELWTYTLIRHKPPGEYLGPEPFEPFGLGLVELPEGLRIMAPLEGDIDSFRIGDQLQLKPWILTAADGQKYRAFRFASSSN
jgi:uncharacterized OB-fold protein